MDHDEWGQQTHYPGYSWMTSTNCAADANTLSRHLPATTLFTCYVNDPNPYCRSFLRSNSCISDADALAAALDGVGFHCDPSSRGASYVLIANCDANIAVFNAVLRTGSPPPTAAAPTFSGTLRVSAGGVYCQVTSAGNCVTDGAGNHANGEACDIDVLVAGTLDAVGVFAVESHPSCACKDS